MTDNQIALILSAASATVAVISFVWTIFWSIWQHRRLHQPRLTVIATNALPVAPGITGEWCIGVTVVNDGGVAVTLTSIKFMVRNDAERRGLFPPTWNACQPHQKPIKLAPGERWAGLTDLAAMRHVLRETFGQRPEYALWVVAIDAADRTYRAKFAVSGH